MTIVPVYISKDWGTIPPLEVSLSLIFPVEQIISWLLETIVCVGDGNGGVCNGVTMAGCLLQRRCSGDSTGS